MANENPFSTSKQLLVVKPKTIAKSAFHYRNFSDAKNLIAFVGVKPKFDINDSGEPVLMYRKSEIKDNSIILTDAFGNVNQVLSYNDAAEMYDIASQSDWKPEAGKKIEPAKKADKKAKK